MKKPVIIVLISSAVFIALAGAGCSQMADQAATEAVSPITAPLAAKKVAVETTDEYKARQLAEIAATTDPVEVALVQMEDTKLPPGAEAGQAFGCNDKIAFVKMARVQASGDDVADAVATLLKQGESSINTLYNALGQSKLTVDKVVSPDGVTTEVWLKGQPQSGGVCDDPRIKTQIEATVARLQPKYKIFLNGTESAWRCFGDMSGKCK